MNIVIKDCKVLTMIGKEPELFDASIGICGNKISVIDKQGDRIAKFIADSGNDLKVIDGKNRLVMPGLINTHGHITMSLLRSCGDDTPLMKWLNEVVWPIEAKLVDEDFIIGTKLSVAEMLLGGTTCCVDMYWNQGLVAKGLDEMGIRAVLGTCFASHENFDRCVQEFHALREQYASNERISVSMAPHAVYTCQEEDLKTAVKIAREKGELIQIHLLETKDEVNIVKERFGCTAVELLEKWGILGEDVIAAHCVHLTDSDIEILRKYKVSVAHNPQSNMKLSSGTAPISKLIERSVNVSLGTDGACSNNDLDMWEELRMASFLQKLISEQPCVVPAYEALKMATVCGAKALGMEGKLGIIKEGAIADIIVLDMNKPHLYPNHNIVANLAYCGKSSDVDTVIVNGTVVVENRELLTGDLDKICADANRSAERLLKVRRAQRL